MLLTVPNYYDAFRCIASDCKDNCCVGWEIDIDDASFARYRSVPGVLGDKLNAAIQPGPPPFFALTEQKRCPFLNDQNLCELYIHLGEEALCEICTEHPRFHNWFGPVRETGLGLCCEEAARLLLTWPEPFSLVQRTLANTPDEECITDPGLLDALIKARTAAFSILQNRALPFQHRLVLLVSLAQDLNGWLCQSLAPEKAESLAALEKITAFYSDTEAPADIIDYLTDRLSAADTDSFFVPLLELLQTLEPNDPAWPDRLKELKSALPHLLENGFGWEDEAAADGAERIACYFVYRYFVSMAVWGDYMSGLLTAVSSVLVIRLLELDTLQKTGYLTLEDRILAAKCYSKEMEYAPENLTALADAIWDSAFFSRSNLMGILLHQ